MSSSPLVTWGVIGGLGLFAVVAVSLFLKEAKRVTTRLGRYRAPWE